MSTSTFSVFCPCPGVLLGLGAIGFLIWQHIRKGVVDLNANLKLAAIVSLILGALPLLIYPFLVMANIMSFAAPQTSNEPFALTLVFQTFLIGTTVYTAVYILCAVLAIVNVRKDKGKPGFICGLTPIICLRCLADLFMVIYI